MLKYRLINLKTTTEVVVNLIVAKTQKTSYAHKIIPEQ